MMSKKIMEIIRHLAEFSPMAIPAYKQKAPKTIGFLLYLYGPLTTSFFVLGLMALLKTSTGPPFPTLNKNIFDQAANTNPVRMTGTEIIILTVAEMASSSRNTEYSLTDIR